MSSVHGMQRRRVCRRIKIILIATRLAATLRVRRRGEASQ
jgi:hypothetical protein